MTRQAARAAALVRDARETSWPWRVSNIHVWQRGSGGVRYPAACARTSDGCGCGGRGEAQNSRTALHLAAEGGYLPVVEALLRVPGVDLNALEGVRARRGAAAGASGSGGRVRVRAPGGNARACAMSMGGGGVRYAAVRVCPRG